MAVEFREALVVDGSAAEVVAVLADVESWPQWTESMQEVRRHNEGPLRAGDTATVRQPGLGTRTWTVTEVSADGFTWSSTSLGVRSVGDHRVHEAGDGRCRVDLIFSLSGWAAPVIGLFGGKVMRRYLKMEADGLQARFAGAR